MLSISTVAPNPCTLLTQVPEGAERLVVLNLKDASFCITFNPDF